MESPCILKQVISGLIELKKDSGILLAPAILKDSAPIAGKCWMVHYLTCVVFQQQSYEKAVFYLNPKN